MSAVKVTPLDATQDDRSAEAVCYGKFDAPDQRGPSPAARNRHHAAQVALCQIVGKSSAAALPNRFAAALQNGQVLSRRASTSSRVPLMKSRML